MIIGLLLEIREKYIAIERFPTEKVTQCIGGLVF